MTKERRYDDVLISVVVITCRYLVKSNSVSSVIFMYRYGFVGIIFFAS
jgi:hypothetical protein